MRKEFKVPFNGFYKVIKDRYYTLILPMNDKEVKSISTGVGFDKIYKNFVVYSEIEDTYTRRILEEIMVEILNIGGSNECNNK